MQSQLIVHGDIKPSNVLVTEEGTVKLVDFGVASLLNDPTRVPRDDAVRSPKALVPGYAPPEQIRGEPLSAASDVYSLGVLLHVLLTRQQPFCSAGMSHTELVNFTMTNEPATASTQIADALERRRVP